MSLSSSGLTHRSDLARLLDGPDARAATSARDHHLATVHAALRTIEQFIQATPTLEPECAQVVAGLLGAQEIETERGRRASGADLDPAKRLHQHPPGTRATCPERSGLARYPTLRADLVRAGHVPAAAAREALRILDAGILDAENGQV